MMINIRNKPTGILLFTIIFTVICITYYSDFLFQLPYGIHDEAQADRLAVAIQFYDNGMNFFLPRTYHIYATDGITPIEFPIHAYCAAILGHIFGRDQISVCFRLLTIAIGYAGLLSLFLVAFRATKDIIISLLVPGLILSSPVFAYYMCNYMPDTAAASVSFIGFYFFMTYRENLKFKTFLLSILFLTVAALIKTSVGLVLLTVMGYCIIDIMFIKQLELNRHWMKLSLVFACSISSLLFYYFYNKHLGNAYQGYIFLMRINPFQNWDELRLYFTYCLSVKFVNEYFTIAHYPILAFLLAAGLSAAFLNKRRQYFFVIVTLLFLGSTSLALLFGRQLIHHDYYFICIGISTIGIILSMSSIEISKLIPTGNFFLVSRISVLCVLMVIFFFGSRYYNKRIAMDEELYPGLKINTPANWMQGCSDVLDKLGIGKDSTIMVLDETAANVGLVYFDRRGINVAPGAWRGNIFNARSYMKDRNIRIMVCNAAKMPEIQTTYVQHFSELFKELYRDERCAVYYLLR